jgi:chromosome segregation ATPase
MTEREKMLEQALERKEAMRYELEASALDMERLTVQCRIEMDALQVAASQSKPFSSSFGSAAESFLNTSLDETTLEGLRQKMRSLLSQREQITVNRQSSEVMVTHCRKLSQLTSTVQAMALVMSEAREKFEGAIESRNATIQEQDGVMADLRNSLEASRMEVAEWAESRRKWLLEEVRLVETAGQLRGQLALAEAHSAESMHVVVTQFERERQVVARLEGTVANLREEVQSCLIELEHEKAHARDEAAQRSDLQHTVGELEKEKAAWKQALAASKTENDALKSNLEKVTYELEYQVQTLTTQVQEGKAVNEMLRKKGDAAHEEIRGLKDDFRKVAESMERDKHTAALTSKGAVGEVAELRERTSYLRSQLEDAELKVKVSNCVRACVRGGVNA